MSVIFVDERPATIGAEKPGGFWQRLAQAIDEHFVDRATRTIPETTLRRSRHEINRCRRLMRKNSLTLVGAGVVLTSRRGATRG